jgi:hypothetical protein
MPRDERVVLVDGAFDDVHNAGRGRVGVEHVGDLVEVRAGLTQLREALLQCILDLCGRAQISRQSLLVDRRPATASALARNDPVALV